MTVTREPAGLARAIEAWAQVLGPDRVRTDRDSLARVHRTTFPRDFDIPAVLLPHSVSEVQGILRIASETDQPVHVVSTGKNWGLGARQPVRSGSVLIELFGMDRILDFDPELATITVQPGVTFAQVDAFLVAEGGDLFLAQTGGPPSGSLIANATERGDGHGCYGDRANSVAGLEVILPTGEVLRTGYRRYNEGVLSRTRRAGIGPSMDGLFLQSNFGVVTEATFWLQPRPAFYAMGYWSVGGDAALPGFIDAVRDLLQRGVLSAGGFTVWNRYKRLAAEMVHPFAGSPDAAAMLRGRISEMTPWAATCSIHAESPAMMNAVCAIISERTEGFVEEIEFFDQANPPDGLEEEDGFPGWQSTGANLRTAYWRKDAVPEGELDPERDGCGVIWLCPATPFTGASVLDVFTLSEQIGLVHGFEPHLGLNPISPRALNLFIALMFDMDVAGEGARAMACHDALMAALVERGHLPYRLGAHAMDMMPPAMDDSAGLLRALKARCDPADILDPGRYGLALKTDEP